MSFQELTSRDASRCLRSLPQPLAGVWEREMSVFSNDYANRWLSQK
jgi:hypothetical protein